MHLADTDAFGDLGLGHALEEAQLDDAPFAFGKDAQQLGDLGAVLDPLECRILVAQARRELAAVSCPTLVIVGEQDAAFLGSCRVMAATIPGARLEVIADAGHSPQLENPAAWYGVLTEFLEAVDAGRVRRATP